jgi:hypothetical protein
MKAIDLIKFIDPGADFFIERIKKHEGFSYSRFNDGEMICAMKVLGYKFNDENCDQHKYFAMMGVELLHTLKKQNSKQYYIQLLCNYINNFNDKLIPLLQSNFLQGRYIYTDWMQKILRYEPEKFRELIKAINMHHTIIVGPEYLKKLHFIHYDDFIEVPLINCYTNKNQIVEDIKQKLQEDSVVLISASMAANVIIDDLVSMVGHQHILLDTGSLFDIFFVDTEKNIVQRTPNLNRLESLRKYYPEFFIR